jgi:stress-induced-phosphoprotein 1
LFKSALLEHNDSTIREQLKKAEKAKKEEEARKYLSAEKAEEHRKIGNELFGAGDFPNAVKEYTEGLKRDPVNKGILSNRSAAYIKLMELNGALKDAEKCLEIDPKFVKAYARKGTIQHMMKEYHKALATFDKGLSIEPDNKDCKEGKIKTMQAIQSGAYSGGSKENDEERFRHAMADPEIQMLMRDPRIQQVLKDFQENPKAAQDAMKDSFISEAINKLIAAGVIKMG